VNKENGIQPAERLAKPKVYQDETYGTCFVYESRSWRQPSDKGKARPEGVYQGYEPRRN
jgi:hypothetical protein